MVSLELLQRGDEAFDPTPNNEVEIMTETECEQVEADELAGRETTGSLLLTNLPGPEHQLAGHSIGISAAVGFGGGEDVPDDDQQLSGNGHDSLLFANAMGLSNYGRKCTT